MLADPLLIGFEECNDAIGFVIQAAVEKQIVGGSLPHIICHFVDDVGIVFLPPLLFHDLFQIFRGGSGNAEIVLLDKFPVCPFGSRVFARKRLLRRTVRLISVIIAQHTIRQRRTSVGENIARLDAIVFPFADHGMIGHMILAAVNLYCQAVCPLAAVLQGKARKIPHAIAVDGFGIFDRGKIV